MQSMEYGSIAPPSLVINCLKRGAALFSHSQKMTNSATWNKTERHCVETKGAPLKLQ